MSNDICKRVHTVAAAALPAAAVAASIAHYLSVRNRLRGDVPLHFDFAGKAGMFVSKSLMFIYPTMVGSAALLMRHLKAHTADCQEQHVLGLSLIVLLLAQIYAARESMGTSRAMPQWMPTVMVAGMVLPFLPFPRCASK